MRPVVRSFEAMGRYASIGQERATEARRQDTIQRVCFVRVWGAALGEDEEIVEVLCC